MSVAAKSLLLIAVLGGKDIETLTNQIAAIQNFDQEMRMCGLKSCGYIESISQHRTREMRLPVDFFQCFAPRSVEQASHHSQICPTNSQRLAPTSSPDR